MGNIVKFPKKTEESTKEPNAVFALDGVPEQATKLIILADRSGLVIETKLKFDGKTLNDEVILTNAQFEEAMMIYAMCKVEAQK